MANNGEIQLLPERRKEIEVKVPGENRILYLGASFMAIFLVIFLGLTIFFSSSRDNIESLAAEIKSLDSQRDRNIESQILLIKDHFSVVDKIINNHVIWSQFLAKIQNKTSPQFTYRTAGISLSDQKINVEGEVLNYTVLARQIASYLSEDIIEDVELEEARLLPTGRIRVSLSILFKTSNLQLGLIDQKNN